MKSRLYISVGLCGLIVCAASLSALWWWNHRERPQADTDSNKSLNASPPRVASPYRNVRDGTRYVGSDTCARCHASEATTYHQHPMGRSLATVEQAAADEKLTTAAGNPFDDGRYRYRVERRDGKMVHTETRLDEQGRVLYEEDEEIAWVMGAGEHGRAYLVNLGGSLFQSPAAWYPQRQTWALSPGYETFNDHFNRPIQSECLFCHTSFADHIEGTVGRYREPVFREQAIGCERCHGPGELHIARHKAAEVRGEVHGGAAFDDTIVNPRDLTPALREAVCQQCHISGAIRVLRADRDWYDYRPGLPLEDFVATFVYTSSPGNKSPITGHVEQMYASRCFQASAGKLGCISCHDPHVKPAKDEAPAYFRQRCLECHTLDTCTAPEEARAATSPADHCSVCHMPAIPTDVRHAAITDHRVPRVRGQGSPMQSAAGQSVLVRFPPSSTSGDLQSQRDLGVAIVRLLDQAPERLNPGDAQTAAASLEDAVARNPSDLDAAEALGHLWWQQGRYADSAALIERVLQQSPRHEFALHTAAMQVEQTGQFDLAAGVWRRLLDVNPAVYHYHQGLALNLGKQRRWAEAIAECRQALVIFPGDSRTRQLLIECLLGNGDVEAAQTEFELLLRFDPEQTSELRRWFDNHPFRN